MSKPYHLPDAEGVVSNALVRREWYLDHCLWLLGVVSGMIITLAVVAAVTGHRWGAGGCVSLFIALTCAAEAIHGCPPNVLAVAPATLDPASPKDVMAG